MDVYYIATNSLKMYLEIDNPQHGPDVKIEHLWPHSFLKRIQKLKPKRQRASTNI
jgi:hypothetical protein